MNGRCFLLTAGLLCHATLFGQTQPAPAAFQPAGILSATQPGRGIILPHPRLEAGRPFSATATTQSTQTLPDGTHINQTGVMVEYRDAEGRVRTEAGEILIIRDPVAGLTYRLDPVKKSAVKHLVSGTPTAATTVEGGAQTTVTAPGTGGGGGRAGKAAQRSASAEDLGMMTVNGIPASGIRTTTVVPVGAVGNDREFHSVDERWFSPDLNLLIKSVSTDPRFGTTTYELTNISRQAPDPALFRVPADYSVLDDGQATPPPGSIRISGSVAASNLESQVSPVYPPLARQARIQGTVKFDAVIGKDGHVANLTLVSGHPLLVAAAQQAVQQWIYRPTLVNGQPTPVVTTIDVNFTLN